MSLWLVAIGVWIITSMAYLVIMINMAQNWDQKVKILKAQRFSLEQELLHLKEGNTDRDWMSAQGGVDDMVTRGRPDVFKIESELPEDNTK